MCLWNIQCKFNDHNNTAKYVATTFFFYLTSYPVPSPGYFVLKCMFNESTIVHVLKLCKSELTCSFCFKQEVQLTVGNGKTAKNQFPVFEAASVRYVHKNKQSMLAGTVSVFRYCTYRNYLHGFECMQCISFLCWHVHMIVFDSVLAHTMSLI